MLRIKISGQKGRVEKPKDRKKSIISNSRMDSKGLFLKRFMQRIEDFNETFQWAELRTVQSEVFHP